MNQSNSLFTLIVHKIKPSKLSINQTSNNWGGNELEIFNKINKPSKIISVIITNLINMT